MFFHSKTLLFAFVCIRLSSTVVEFVDGFAVARPMLTFTARPQMKRSSSLAVKGGGKNNKSSKRAAQTAKGFGLPPPKLDDVLATFKTRIPEDADNQPCPCGTARQLLYGNCCGPLHRGDRKCTTISDVLRSRYSAFSWRIIEYVMATTHESCRDYREDRIAWANDLHRKGMFDGFEFVGLSAGEEETENENEGFIEFKVIFRARNDGKNSVAGHETVISERSKFLRNPTDGTWSYASGDVRSDVAGLEGTTLNAG